MSNLHKSFISGLKKPAVPSELPLLAECVGLANLEASASTQTNYSTSDLIPETPSQDNAHDQSEARIPSQSSDESLCIRQSEDHHQIFDVIEDYSIPSCTKALRVYFALPTLPTSPVLFCIHGAGSSSMTFAALASHMRGVDNSIGICCYDLRGHGDSSPTADYSMQAFISDTELVVRNLCTKHGLSQNPFFFVGHSLGGAILSAYLSQPGVQKPPVKLGGLALLDIVQETAEKSLGAMPGFIRKRPTSFLSLREAIDWHMGLLLFNRDSAEISVPHLLHHADLLWKTDLALTQPYWNEWFENLSQNFLGFKGPKLLILSTHEALDKNLIVGQMQGRYQLVAFNNNHRSGHFVQEDLPELVSACILDFIKRNDSPERFMRENMGIIPKWGGAINK